VDELEPPGVDTGMSLTYTMSFTLAQDRPQWRAVATAAKALCMYLTD